MRKIFLFFITVLLILFSGYLVKEKFFTKIGKIEINGKDFKVELAQTSGQKEKGLSGRLYLPQNTGMLFVFQKPDYYSFWMKNTFLKLDFVWIRDGKIVDITGNVTPSGNQSPKSLIPKCKVDTVLEMNAGTIKKYNFRIGDKVKYSP